MEESYLFVDYVIRLKESISFFFESIFNFPVVEDML